MLLEDSGMYYDEIFPGEKLVADYYIDDRAVPFQGNWSEVLSQVLARKVSG